MLLEYVGGGTLTQFMSETEIPTGVEDIVHLWKGLLDLMVPLMRIHCPKDMGEHHQRQGSVSLVELYINT